MSSGFRLGKHKLGAPAHPDVKIVNPTAGQLLKYINNAWRNQFLALDELSDVEIATPSDGQVVTYEAASGLWKNKAPSAGTIGKGFKAYSGSNQVISGDGISNLVNIDTEVFDDYGEFDPVNHKFTPQVSGKYFIAFGFTYASIPVAGDGCLFRGHFSYTYGVFLTVATRPRITAAGMVAGTGCTAASLTVANDYYFYVDQNTGSNQTLSASQPFTWLTVFRLF